MDQPWTIERIRKSRVGLLPNVLSPRRFGVVGCYSQLRDLWRGQALRGVTSFTTVALGLPECLADGVLRVNFPVYTACKNLQTDRKVADFLGAAESEKLILSSTECGVGAILRYLAGDRLMDPSLAAKLEVDVAAYNDKTWLCIPDPGTRYGSVFQPSWTDRVKAKWFFVHPIVLEPGYLCAAFAADLASPKEPTDLFATIRTQAELLVRNLFLAYYSHLDPPSDTLKGTLRKHKVNPSSLPWAADGRVLARTYLDRLSDSTDPFAGMQDASEKCVLLYCDGDGIKRLNDAHGHSVGNEVIRALGRILWEAAEQVSGRGEGIVSRWGGDEFVVMLVPKEGQEPSSMAASFRNEVEIQLRKVAAALESSLGCPGLATMVGVSIGWAEWSKGSANTFREAWSRDAERAMYVAKEGARLLRDAHAKDRGVPEFGLVSMAEFRQVQLVLRDLRKALGEDHPSAADTPREEEAEREPHEEEEKGDWGCHCNLRRCAGCTVGD